MLSPRVEIHRVQHDVIIAAPSTSFMACDEVLGVDQGDPASPTELAMRQLVSFYTEHLYTTYRVLLRLYSVRGGNCVHIHSFAKNLWSRGYPLLSGLGSFVRVEGCGVH